MGKGALIVKTDSTISGIAFEDVTVPEGNGSGIRHDAGALAVHDCAFLRCQDGYLGIGESVAFAHCLFDACGLGDGQTHAIYVSAGVKRATATACRFRGTKIGHHFKSRAENSLLVDCRMEPATESYSADFPWGGVVDIWNCHMAQGPDTDNNVLVNYGSERNSPLALHSFAMSDCTLTSRGVAHAVGLRFDPRIPVNVTLTNVHFVGIETPMQGGTVTFKGCTKDGVSISE
jgi:hypothetical protein